MTRDQLIDTLAKRVRSEAVVWCRRCELHVTADPNELRVIVGAVLDALEADRRTRRP